MDLSRLRDIWNSLGGKGQVSLVAAVIAVLGAGFLLYGYAATPSYSTLVSGLATTDASSAVKALEGAGIAYKLDSTGTSISVLDSQVAAARLALANGGVLNNGHVGFELFDKSTLGMTDFQQKVDYQRALEGEIARTIEQISGVQTADVQLVIPDQVLFASQSSQASAAVLITGNLSDPSTVSGIAHLVASSVKGLSTQNVTITDSTGQLLWPAGGSGGGLASATKLEAEQRYQNDVSNQINALLVSTLGAGKAQVRVHADLSLDQTQIDKIAYAKKGTALTTQTDTETYGAGVTPPNNVAGTAANVPGATVGTTTTTTPTTTTPTTTTPTTTTPTTTTPTGTTSTSGNGYLHTTDSTTWGVDRTVSHTTIAPGSINRIDVALLVDSSVPKAQLAALRTAVGSMAGIDPKRGDTLTVSQVAFAPQPKVAAAPKSPLAALPVPVSVLKDVLLGFAGLVFVFLLSRSLKKREKDGFVPEPTWLREIESDWPIRELDAPTMRLELEPAAQRRAVVRDEIGEIARAQPDKIATQVSQWMRE